MKEIFRAFLAVMLLVFLLIAAAAISGCSANIIFDRASGTVTANDYIIKERLACPKGYASFDECKVVSRTYTPKSILTGADAGDMLTEILPLLPK